MTMNWDERFAYVQGAFAPWIETTGPLDGAFVVEFGCGTGAVSAAMATRARRVYGLDIDDAAVREAKEHAASRRLTHVTFASGAFEMLLNEVRSLGHDIDVLLLFAVLEHMTVAERLRLLELARDSLRADSRIVVIEMPNRLLWWDYHTAELPFFGMLPDELALRYAPRSARTEFVEGITRALKGSEDGAVLELYRHGRGVSFHEFDLVFADFPQCVLACNYEVELMRHRPVHREELYLARFLKRAAPHIPPAFSRYYIDFISTPEPASSRPSYIEPWPFETSASRDVFVTPWETLAIRAKDARLVAHLEHAASELLLGVEVAKEPVQLTIEPDGGTAVTLELQSTGRPETQYVAVELDPPATSVSIGSPQPCDLSFLGSGAAG